ncbi:FMN-binding protein [bacterium]|nr:FMN-binding protein [bacterium]
MRRNRALFGILACLLCTAPLHADTVELLNGIRVNGTLLYETDGQVVIDTSMGGGTARMRFLLAKVHAITTDGKRRVVNEKTAKPSAARPRTARPTTAAAKPATKPSAETGRVVRSAAEVDALINKVGRTAPDWFDSVPLDYPKTLDLSWPDRPGGQWNYNKNVGQYLFSVINENPSKWRSGIRFLHHLLTVHKDDPQKLTKVMDTLGNRYFMLLQDAARAAFWYRQADKRRPVGLHGRIRLAECYWRLGSKVMAERELKKASRYIAPGIVKLLSDMGELKEALAHADLLGRTRLALAGYMAAGDACRQHGRYQTAVAYYQKVLALPAEGKQRKHIEKVKARARASIEAVRVVDALDLRRVREGTHTATAESYAGPLTLEVKVAGGRIESIKVTQYRDKQYFNALTDTPRQIVEKQGLKGVDAISGATITSQAIINATAKALANAMR